MELSQRHRTGTLIDRRFGEEDETVSKEDKMLIRFQRTRQRQLVNEKRQTYNLNSDDDDGGEEEVILTHKGKRLDEINYGAPRGQPSRPFGRDEEDDDGSISEDSFEEAKRDGGAKRSESSDFGGLQLKSRTSDELDEDGDPNPGFLKSKAEVMNELIAKSKMHRYQAQKERSERSDQIDALNEGFDELRELLGLDMKDVRALKKQQREHRELEKDDEGSEVESDEEDSFDDQVSDDQENGSGSGSGSEQDEEEEDDDEESPNPNAMEVDDFDAMVKRLSQPGVRRAKPSNALLTEEHVAKAEQARLMQMEKQRLARMNAQLTGDVEGEEEKKKNIAAPLTSRRAGADDLDDEFSRQWLPQQSDDEDSDEDDDEEEEEEDGEEDEEDSEAEDASDDAGSGSSDEEDYESKPAKKAKLTEESNGAPSKLAKVSALSPEGELPYTLAMPEDYESFSQLISNQSPKRQAIIISRLRACHHLSLGASNRSKLQDLLRYLFKRVMEIGLIWSKTLKTVEKKPETPAKPSTPKKSSSTPKKTESSEEQTNGGGSTQNETVDNLVHLLEILLKPIFEMANQLPDFALVAAKEQLLQLETAHLKKLSTSTVDPSTSVVPTFQSICFSQICSIVFSPTDRRHALVSPLIIHLLHVLGTCRMQHYADVNRSVFLANAMLGFLSPAKRFAGEPFSLLFFIIRSFLDQNDVSSTSDLFDTFNPMLYIQPNSLKLASRKQGKSSPVEAKASLQMLVLQAQEGIQSVDPSDSDKIQAIHTTLCVLNSYLHSFSADVAAVELFQHSKRLLAAIPDDLLPDMTTKLKKAMIATCERVSSAMGQMRVPLQQFLKVAEPLPSLTPDFDDSYFGEKMTIDKVAKETKRMKRKIKSEQKGAEKELRKDTRFIQQQKMKIRGEKSAERRASSNATLAMLQSQQSEMNKAAIRKDRQKKK
jgi:nucleolar protein 14